MASFAPRYARALADVVRDRRLNAAEIVEQLRSLVETFTANPQLKTVWENPSVDGQQKKQIESKVAAVTGKTVRATYREDRELLGGVIVKVGSTIYDGSVRGQLERLKEQLIAG